MLIGTSTCEDVLGAMIALLKLEIWQKVKTGETSRGFPGPRLLTKCRLHRGNYQESSRWSGSSRETVPERKVLPILPTSISTCPSHPLLPICPSHLGSLSPLVDFPLPITMQKCSRVFHEVLMQLPIQVPSSHLLQREWFKLTVLSNLPPYSLESCIPTCSSALLLQLNARRSALSIFLVTTFTSGLTTLKLRIA